MKRLATVALILSLAGCSTGTSYSTPDTPDEFSILETVWQQQTLDEQTEMCAGVLLYGADWAAGKILEGDTSDVLSYSPTVDFLTGKCL